jgi:hypothetical protein
MLKNSNSTNISTLKVADEDCSVSDITVTYDETNNQFVITGNYAGTMYMGQEDANGEIIDATVVTFTTVNGTTYVNAAGLPPGIYQFSKCDPRHGGRERINVSPPPVKKVHKNGCC